MFLVLCLLVSLCCLVMFCSICPINIIGTNCVDISVWTASLNESIPLIVKST